MLSWDRLFRPLNLARLPIPPLRHVGCTLPKNVGGAKWRERKNKKRKGMGRGRAVFRPRHQNLRAEGRGASTADRAVGSGHLEAGGTLSAILFARFVVAARCCQRRL